MVPVHWKRRSSLKKNILIFTHSLIHVSTAKHQAKYLTVVTYRRCMVDVKMLHQELEPVNKSVTVSIVSQLRRKTRPLLLSALCCRDNLLLDISLIFRRPERLENTLAISGSNNNCRHFVPGEINKRSSTSVSRGSNSSVEPGGPGLGRACSTPSPFHIFSSV